MTRPFDGRSQVPPTGVLVCFERSGAVACGDGAVRILELQRAGRQAMKADEFLRGTSVAAGTRLG